MFWMTIKGWPLRQGRTIQEKCTNCGNTAEHFVYVQPHGLQMGFIFLPKRAYLGRRKYYLACSVCGFMARELTKEQAGTFKG